jgi:hypothetical protein
MRKITPLAICIMLLICLNAVGTFCQSRDANHILITRLNAVNQRLKKADLRTEGPKLVGEVWAILDEELCSYLGRNDELSVQELNEGLAVLLQTDEKIDDSHSITRIDLYNGGNPDLFVATYADLYLLGARAFTLRILHKMNGRWHVVGRIEDTSFVNNLLPQYRQELKHQLKLKAEKRSHPPIAGPDLPELQSSLIVSHSIDEMGILISPASIQALHSGGLKFVAIHTAVATHSASTLIEWEWTPRTALRAVSWVWGDQWSYDEKNRSEVGRWKSLNKEMDGKPVKFEDFVPR